MADEQAQAVDNGTDAGETAAEVERLRDRWLRARADLENYRKRADREVELRVTEAHNRMLNDCLEIADSVDHAVATADPGRAHEALRQVQEQMRAALGRHGAERMEAMGQPFDPTVHEAVGVRETDQAPPGVVVDVVRAGYRVGDAVLRPARVIVSARPTGDSGG